MKLYDALIRRGRAKGAEAILYGPVVIARIPLHVAVVEIMDDSVTLRLAVHGHRGHEVTLREDDSVTLNVNAYHQPEPS